MHFITKDERISAFPTKNERLITHIPISPYSSSKNIDFGSCHHQKTLIFVSLHHQKTSIFGLTKRQKTLIISIC